jgi:hypothetical protein
MRTVLMAFWLTVFASVPAVAQRPDSLAALEVRIAAPKGQAVERVRAAFTDEGLTVRDVSDGGSVVSTGWLASRRVR